MRIILETPPWPKDHYSVVLDYTAQNHHTIWDALTQIGIKF